MDSVKSFKGYGKVDPAADQEFHRKARRRLVILIVSVVILVSLVVGAAVGILVHKHENSSTSHTNAVPTAELTSAAKLKALCNVTRYPKSCYNSIASLNNSHSSTTEELVKISLHEAVAELEKVTKHVNKLTSKTSNKKAKAALKVCETLFDDAIERLNESISSMEVKHGSNKLSNSLKIDDVKTWLSTTITDQETCLDALHEMNATVLGDIKSAMQNSKEYTSNSLAIVAKILGPFAKLEVSFHRRLLGFPRWLSAGDRRLLQEAPPPPNLTVAQDGSGDCKTIKEAVAKVPKQSVERFVIYVKAGEYVENVVLDKSMWNVMMYGDGKEKTTVSGRLNFVDGTPTFNTATFAVDGRGFIAKDMKFVNTAGPEKQQAVAFRSGSDRSVFYRCAFDGYQDTLYAHSNRQFYRECDITGTVDFIFGNAAVVFQNCNILPRQPLPKQFNTITAQGKEDPNQNTGISIQKCTFAPLSNSLTAPTYLGRPWKDYSTTVIMESEIGGFLNPKGWTEWLPGVSPPSSIFYAEYQNIGPGADLSRRVTWPGYKPTLTPEVASKYTVGSFIQGTEWLTEAKVTFE